ncbi:hypothetical protein MKEN_01169300 [Mycena kentingensis (nom. inval.)]|nr:hypothetical protein MKEN_01169300 [Mycena kentingensis (nom. inval.)]
MAEDVDAVSEILERHKEPHLVIERRANRLKRKQFYAAGVNDLWAIDQHDKWKYSFGLALHCGVEPFSGELLWIKVWWTNSNPRLILGYHLDTVEKLGFMPLVTQSDPGVENFGVANGHTLLRHYQDPSLMDTLQHQWKNEKKNIKPEMVWSQFRRRFAPGFQNILEIGTNEGWYDTSNLLETLVFRFIFIPWLQREIDAYVERLNNTAKRRDRNKILPHGVPRDIFENAEAYGALDFKIKFDPNAIQQVRDIYAPRDHDVFKLVPEDISIIAMDFYAALGSPTVTRDNVWEVYLGILKQFEQLDAIHRIPPEMDSQWGYALTMARDDYRVDDLELIPNLKLLEQGSGSHAYYGGVNNGRGLGPDHHAQLDAMLEQDEPLPAETICRKKTLKCLIDDPATLWDQYAAPRPTHSAVLSTAYDNQGDPVGYTITDELLVLGMERRLVYSSRVRLTEGGMEAETAAGMGTRTVASFSARALREDRTELAERSSIKCIFFLLLHSKVPLRHVLLLPRPLPHSAAAAAAADRLLDLRTPRTRVIWLRYWGRRSARAYQRRFPLPASSAPSPPPPPAAAPPANNNRQSVDWYAGLAADSGPVAVYKMPMMREEVEEQYEPVVSVPPAIRIEEHVPEPEPEAGSDLMPWRILTSLLVQLKVRALYAYEADGAEDITFGENVILIVNPWKSGGE